MKCNFAFVLMLFATLSFAQNNYYVSTTGLNMNSGSFLSPWKTVQHGSEQLMPGDTLNILAGSYAEKINWPVSGTSSQHITMRNYQAAEVFIDAVSFSDSDPIFYAHNHSYYRIHGLHFTNCYNTNGAGLYVDGYGHGIELVNCKFSNISISTDPNTPVNTNTNQPTISFIGSSAADSLSDILVDGLEVFNCRPGFSECLTISGNATDFVFTNNHVHDNANIGIDATGNYGVCPVPALDNARRGLIKNNLCEYNSATYATSAGIYVDGGHDIVIENNISHHNGFGIDIGCEEPGTTENIVVRNNLIYQNQIAGMQLGGYDPISAGAVLDCVVSNNTFYKNDTEMDGNGAILFSQFENSSIINNIFYLSSQDYLMSEEQSQPNLVMNYNLVFNDNGASNISAYWNNVDITGLSNIYSTVGMGANDTYGNPQFVDIASSTLDLHLMSNSPAIDAGDPSFMGDPTETDIDGQSRIENLIVDCGADEYTITSSAQIVTTPLDITLYPNPFTDQLTIDGNLGEYYIKVYDAVGLEVADFTGSAAPLTIDLTALGAGIYFIAVEHLSQNSLRVFTNIKF